jgi:predicted DsbA family dithiol-disulfide isomerase
MSAGNRLGISVHFDLICPWCLIGLRQLELARARFAQAAPGVAVETRWRPVTLLPELPPAGLPYAEFYERRLGSAQAVRQRREQVERAARKVGLPLDLAGIARMPNSARAHSLLRRVEALALPGLYESLLKRLFAAHFQRGEDIGDEATLRSLAAEVGVPMARLAASTPGEAAPAPPAAGIVGVPHFVFNDGISRSGAQDDEVLFTAMNLAMGVRGTLRAAVSEAVLRTAAQ